LTGTKFDGLWQNPSNLLLATAKFSSLW